MMDVKHRSKQDPSGFKTARDVHKEHELASSSPSRSNEGFFPRMLTQTKLASDELMQKAESTSEADEGEYDEPSQVSLSQTDETIRRLEKEGGLSQVIGSQSILSQELLYSSLRREDEDDDEEEDDDDDDRFPGLHNASQQTESSIAMAQRLGLLTQEMTQEDDEEEEEQHPCSSPHSSKNGNCTGGNAEQHAILPVATASCAAVEFDSQVTTLSQISALHDISIRESECFGSLLDAVQRITQEEEVNAKLYSLEYRTSGSVETNSQESTSDDGDSPIPKNSSSGKRKSSYTSLEEESSPKKSRKNGGTKRKESEQRKSQEIAQRAAALAEQTIRDPEMAKKLLLSMALVRENPRTAPSDLPPRGAVVPEGFFWAHYPPLEAVLKEHMAEYYELSTTKCQSAQQQSFNNKLVVVVRQVAKDRGWKFHSSFSDKCLRDRIRCYYKTHIQNAKKRLRTMVRNPTKRANARHLCAHLDLIEQHGQQKEYGDDSSADEDDGETIPQPVKSSRKVKNTKKKTPMESSPSPSKSKSKPRTSKIPRKSPTAKHPGTLV